jgi:hypothetical protein
MWFYYLKSLVSFFFKIIETNFNQWANFIATAAKDGPP